MTSATQTWTSSITEISGSSVELVTGGSGNPLVILHDELGHPGWLNYHQALSRNHTVHVPSHPGFGQSDQLDWSMKMHDMAIWYLGAFDKLGLEGADLMGFSLGGWLAAELATMCPQQFRKLILVGAGGVRPPGGQIFDMFEVTPPLFIQASLLDPDGTPEYRDICPAEPDEDLLERWETALEGTCRVSWRPYMHDPWPGAPGLPAGANTHLVDLGSTGRHRAGGRRAGIQSSHSRQPPGDHRKLRPPPRVGSYRPVCEPGRGIPGVVLRRIRTD